MLLQPIRRHFSQAVGLGRIQGDTCRRLIRIVRRNSSEERSEKQFQGQGTVQIRSSSSSEKAVGVEVQEPSQSSRLVGPGRSVGLVGPRGIQGTVSAKQKLLK
jgi:hypothetical protein